MNITAKCRSNNLKCGNNNNYYNNYWQKGVAGGRGEEEKHLNNVEANATTATLSKQTARLRSTEAATGSATASAAFAAASAAALWQRVKA